MRFLFWRGLPACLTAGVVVAAGSLFAGPAFGIAGGIKAPADGYGFVAYVKVGDAVRGCSGALVDPEWIVTAKSCFADGTGPVSAGPPTHPTTVTVGREDLTVTNEGQVRAVSEVVPHPDRDVLLAKLASPVINVSPIRIGASAPAVGEVLQVAGFGRTTSDWVPDRLHLGSFTVQAVTTAGLDVTGNQASPASICKGDAGGPALRSLEAAYELVALNGPSWQARCLGTPESETRNGAMEIRLDNVKDWIRQTVRGGNFVRLATSAQVLDTRTGVGTPSGPRTAGNTTTFQVTGVGGIPTTGVTAVLIDMTVISATGTFLNVFPDGTTRNAAVSMVNTAPNQTISNTAVVPIPTSGKLSVYNFAAGTHIVMDVQGYYTTASGTGGGFVPVDYTRVVDTRSGVGGSSGSVPTPGNRTFAFPDGVIPAGASSAFLDIIVTGATRHGWVGAFPPGGTNDRSVMDYVPGTLSHGVAVQLSSDRRATFTNNSGSAVHFVMTATGYFTSSATTGAGLRTLAPARVLDTRSDGDGAPPVAANGSVDAPLGVPAGATALVNLTVYQNTAGGFLRVWPIGGTESSASLTTYPEPNSGGARSGLAAVKVGADGKIRIRNAGSGTVHILVDVQGWYAQPLP